MKTVTQSQLALVLATLQEVGYWGLDDEERAICDAFDNGTLRIIPPQTKKFTELS